MYCIDMQGIGTFAEIKYRCLRHLFHEVRLFQCKIGIPSFFYNPPASTFPRRMAHLAAVSHWTSLINRTMLQIPVGEQLQMPLKYLS